MSFFKDSDNETILKVGNIYLAERKYQGVKSGYTGSSTCHFTKTSGLCLKKTLPTATSSEIQVFDTGGSVHTAGGNTYYLGHYTGYTTEHAPEINQVTAKFEKNGTAMMEDLAGLGITFKFKIAHIASKDWRELMLVSKTETTGENSGIRGISATPSSVNFNRFFLVSVVDETTSGKTIIHQYRKARVKMLSPSGGGTEYMSAEVEVTPLPDTWAEKKFNLGGDLIVE